VVAFLLKVHFPSALLALFLGSFVAPLLDPLLDIAGGWVLTRPFLRTLWASLYAIPFVPWTRFNNTVVMGGLLVGLLLSVPVYVLARRGIHLYRERWRERIAELPLVKAFLTAPLVVRVCKLLKKISGLAEGV
jgi:uncharacterized protein (TIGR03546 family)